MWFAQKPGGVFMHESSLCTCWGTLELSSKVPVNSLCMSTRCDGTKVGRKLSFPFWNTVHFSLCRAFYCKVRECGSVSTPSESVNDIWCAGAWLYTLKVNTPSEHVSTSARHVSAQESRQCRENGFFFFFHQQDILVSLECAILISVFCFNVSTACVRF